MTLPDRSSKNRAAIRKLDKGDPLLGHLLGKAGITRRKPSDPVGSVSTGHQGFDRSDPQGGGTLPSVGQKLVEDNGGGSTVDSNARHGTCRINFN